MSKILSKLFPITDHLYIFQILEYNIPAFLRWFLKYPFKRNLQKKHHLDLTQKAWLLLSLSMFLVLLTSISITLVTIWSTWSVLLLIILLLQLAPIFLTISQTILLPLEIYQKNNIMNTATKKLGKLINLKIIAITGSFAKTSTKNILYTLLWKDFKVVKTPKSYNNPLSIAQTILEDLKDNSQIFIAEIGAYQKGEIARLTRLLKPDIAIITGVAPQHLEKFGSLENIAQAKFELVVNTGKRSLAILNGNSDHLKKLSNKAPCPVIFYGQPGNTIFASDIEVKGNGTSFLLHSPKGHALITIPLVGEHHVQNFLAAAAAALNLGLALETISLRAKLLIQTPHRLEIKKQGSLTIIDNSYNTNPDSARVSFELLSELEGEEKIIITPGLVELGRESQQENQNFAKEAGGVADQVIIVGDDFKEYLLAGLTLAKFPMEKIHFAKSTQEAVDKLSQIAKPNSVVLIENDLPDSYF